MKTPRVKLFIRVRLPNGSQRYVQPVMSNNHALRSLWGVVNGNNEHHPEGSYYLRYRPRKGERRCWEALGQDATFALAAKARKEKELRVKAEADEVGLTVAGEDGKPRVLLTDAIAEYLADTKAQKAHKTHNRRILTMKYFADSCRKAYLDQIDRRDLLDFRNYLKNHGQGDRSIFNHFQGAITFLRSQGIAGLISRNDWPTYTAKKVAAYSEAELKTLFDTASPEERLAFQFFLGSGAREQEVQYACWTDIDFRSKTFCVKEKTDLGFKPKDREEREVPLPDALRQNCLSAQVRGDAA